MPASSSIWEAGRRRQRAKALRAGTQQQQKQACIISLLNFRLVNTEPSRPEPFHFSSPNPNYPSTSTVYSAPSIKFEHRSILDSNFLPSFFEPRTRNHHPAHAHFTETSSTMAGGKGKSSGGKSSGGKTSAAEGPKKQQSHSARAGLQVCRVYGDASLFFLSLLVNFFLSPRRHIELVPRLRVGRTSACKIASPTLAIEFSASPTTYPCDATTYTVSRIDCDNFPPSFRRVADGYWPHNPR